MSDKGDGRDIRKNNSDQARKPKDRAQRLGNQVRDTIRAAAHFFKRMVGRN